jgi:hypothetical protein
MLCGSPETTKEFVKAWRERATRVAEEAFKLVQQEEKVAFGERSYFYHLERLEQEGIPFPMVEEDCEDLDQELLEDDRTTGLRFAEEGMASRSKDSK